MLAQDRFLREKGKWDYTTPLIPEAGQNYQSTAIVNHRGTKHLLLHRLSSLSALALYEVCGLYMNHLNSLSELVTWKF